MANTLIQIKRSTGTATPASLTSGELAYSYLSDKLFLGNSTGTNVIEIGGNYYINATIAAFNFANTANDRAVSAFNAANSSISSSSGPAFDKANAANIIASLAFDKANSANLLAFNTGIGANAFAAATIAGANTAVGTGANNYLLAVIAGANTAVGTGANAYMIVVQNGSNTAIGAGANSYADATFIKLVAPNQTITGNLSITGSLSVSGNTFKIDANTLYVQDPLIYLAGNNYISDIVDIGFVGNYVNSTGSNVHTGLFRDSTVKEYFLFHGYDQEPTFNDIDPNGNNFTLSVLNAAIRTSNLNLGGANAIQWITAAFDKANSANLLAFNTGIGANAFTSATIAGANTAVGTGANNYLLTVIAGANTAVGTGANNYLLAVIAGANTAVGAGANSYAALVGASANTNAANASYISTGTLAVSYGGTGVTSIANNGVVFGSGTSAIRNASTSTEGHVLQANQFGTPFFGMLDGGSF